MRHFLLSPTGNQPFLVFSSVTSLLPRTLCWLCAAAGQRAWPEQTSRPLPAAWGCADVPIPTAPRSPSDLGCSRAARLPTSPLVAGWAHGWGNAGWLGDSPGEGGTAVMGTSCLAGTPGAGGGGQNSACLAEPRLQLAGEPPPSAAATSRTSHLPPGAAGGWGTGSASSLLPVRGPNSPVHWGKVAIWWVLLPSLWMGPQGTEVALGGVFSPCPHLPGCRVHHQRLPLPFAALLTQTRRLRANPCSAGEAGCTTAGPAPLCNPPGRSLS